MLVKSYSELYLDDVSRNIGTIFEYAIDYGFDPIVFWDIFICSEVVKEIENGNPRFLVGLSGVELFNKIIQNEEFSPEKLAQKKAFDFESNTLKFLLNFYNFSTC